jgi:hypothetical protein
MSRPEDRKRRLSILVSLLFNEGRATVLHLRDDLETTHFLAATRDKVRADLAFLADLGLIERQGEFNRLTPEGHETAVGLRELP